MVKYTHAKWFTRLGRCFKHACYMPWRSRQLIKASTLRQLANSIGLAEQGHRGEIKVVIEGALSPLQAATLTNRQRAEQLFSHLAVWDTQHNSGVLLYINLCDHTIDLVADRGINAHVPSGMWYTLCADIAKSIHTRNIEQGLCDGISQLGVILADYYAQVGDDTNNELPNIPLVLR